jgi:uncharacterized protein YegP (UPF0339 family)
MADVPGNFRLDRVGDDRGAPFIWILTADVEQTMATSGPFPDRATAERAVQWVKDNASKCGIVDASPRGPTIV